MPMHYNNERQTPLSPCPKQEELDNSEPSANNRHQRCHNRMSPSSFQSRFATIPTIVPSAVRDLRANALTTSGSVWEKPSKAMPDLLSRLRPWQPGATVKKLSLGMMEAKETRQVQPSQTSIERLRRLKEQSGIMCRMNRKSGKE